MRKLPFDAMKHNLLPSGCLLALCLFLGGCKGNSDSQSVLDAVQNVTSSATGAIATAKSGVQGAIDAGHMAAGSAKKIADDVADRVNKIQKGTELIKEGFGIGTEETEE